MGDPPFGSARRGLLPDSRGFVAVVGRRSEAFRGSTVGRRLRPERIQLDVAVLQRFLLSILSLLFADRLSTKERPQRTIHSKVRTRVEGCAQQIYIRPMGSTGFGSWECGGSAWEKLPASS